MSARRRWTLPLLTLLVMGAAIVWALLPRPVPADAARVTRGLLRLTVDEDGRTRIRERYVVAAPLQGLMHRIALNAGDPVDAGGLITSITPTAPGLLDAREHLRAEAAISAAEAGRERARAAVVRALETLTFSRAEVTRRALMIQRQAITQQEYDDWVHREKVAAAELVSAEMAVRVADFEWEQAKAVLVHVRPVDGAPPPPPRYDVASPIGGRVLRVFEENAGVVAAGTRLVEIGDPLDLEVEIDVLSRDAVRIAPGTKVLFEQWGGAAPLIGRVRRIEPAGFTKISALGIEEQRVNVLVDFITPPEGRKSLGDAYRVEARIVIWENADVVKAPAGALFRHGDGWAAFVIVDGRAALRTVQVGNSDGIESEVLGGLSEGDAVILHAPDRVRDGIAIAVR